MRTFTTTVYDFHELDEEAQKVAIEYHQQINVEYDPWWENVYEIWKTKLEAMGFSDVEISSDTSHCQGSGASVTARHDDRYCSIQRKPFGGNYVHEYSVWVCLDEDDGYQVPEEFTDNFEERYAAYRGWKDELIELCCAIHKDLLDEQEYQLSDQAVRETLLANDWFEFCEDGCMYRG